MNRRSSEHHVGLSNDRSKPNQDLRRLRVTALIVCLFVPTTVGAYIFRAHAGSDARRDLAELAETSSLIQELDGFERLGADETVHSSEATSLDPATLARVIETAASACGIEGPQIERVWPQPAQRLDDRDYVRFATQLVIRDVTLAATLEFLDTLRSGKTTGNSPEQPSQSLRLNIDAIRLVAPRSTGTEPSSSTASSETWTLEATVSHVAFRPSSSEGM